MSQVIISSVQDLILELEKSNNEYSGSIWYRGQSNFEWGLLPSFLRLGNNGPSEATLLKRFKQTAAMLISDKPEPDFGWQFLMQHYGVPTRLLDWTESPLVALYFAVENAEKFQQNDAALWSLKPTEMNKHAHISVDSESFYIPSFDDLELENYTEKSLSANFKTKLNPIATIATRNSPRIQAQQGVFSIHHNDNTPLEQIGDGSHTKKYLIPSDCKTNIRNQLKILGISKFQLFPELQSVGEIITGDFT